MSATDSTSKGHSAISYVSEYVASYFKLQVMGVVLLTESAFVNTFLISL